MAGAVIRACSSCKRSARHQLPSSMPKRVPWLRTQHVRPRTPSSRPSLPNRGHRTAIALPSLRRHSRTLAQPSDLRRTPTMLPVALPVRTPSVGVGVLVSRDDEWLLLRRANVHGDGTWSTPGGHLDFGEDPADCARREAAEETGLRVGEVRFLGVTSDIFDTHRHYITLWFEATNVDGEATLSAPEEMSELGWFPRRELPELLFAPLRRLLDGECFGPGVGRHS